MKPMTQTLLPCYGFKALKGTVAASMAESPKAVKTTREISCNALLRVPVRQRLEHKRTPFVDRNHWDFEYLISASTVPLLHDPIDQLGMLERVVAFRIVLVDRLPRRQDEDLWKILVL